MRRFPIVDVIAEIVVRNKSFQSLMRFDPPAFMLLIKLYSTVSQVSMQAIFNGTVIADSDDIVMVDGNPYFPRSAMRTDYFRESSHSTVCGWKGTARYWDVVLGDQVISNAVWAYDDPRPKAESIRERFAFYRGKGVDVV